MTKARSNVYEEVMNHLKLSRFIQKSKSERDNPSNPNDVIKSAEKGLRDAFYGQLVASGSIDPKVLKRADLNDPTNPNYENGNKLIEGKADLELRHSETAASTKFKSNLDDFVGSVPEGDLEKMLANDKSAGILAGVADDKETFGLYKAHESLKKFAEDYRAKGDEAIDSKETAQKIMDYKIKGARAAEMKSVKEKGYNERDQASAGELAEFAAKIGFTGEKGKEYALTGIESEVKEIEERLKAKGDFRKALRGAYENLANRNLVVARDLAYGAHVDKIDEEVSKYVRER
ncbi:hypothetical protein J4408_00550 [Candidatus Pacearchaeota archaeon]|nr:hypothetical protein [Candidatus Pacearchaeota archaeon]